MWSFKDYDGMMEIRLSTSQVHRGNDGIFLCTCDDDDKGYKTMFKKIITLPV